MSKKPKSIWRKSWSGLNWLRAWVIVVAATFVVILAISFFLPGGPRTFDDWLVASLFLLFISTIVATLFVGLWSLIRWMFSVKNFRRSLFAVACLATLIALFYAEEDWRGWHDWNQFKHKWEAKGEKFGWQSVVPPPVPDDQNFAFSPVWIAEMKDTFQNTPTRAEAWYGKRIYSEEVSKYSPAASRFRIGFGGNKLGLSDTSNAHRIGELGNSSTDRLKTVAGILPWF